MAKTQGQGDGQPPVVTPQTKTGGGGDDDGQPQVPTPQQPTAAQEEEQPILKRRLDLFGGELTASRLPDDYEFSFDPNSMVGSFFLKVENGEVLWLGRVIGQPAADQLVYLVWVERQEPGAEKVQRIVPVQEMVSKDEGYEWRFYDTEAEVREAFASWVVTQERSS
jgi:hypothetical protein